MNERFLVLCSSDVEVQHSFRTTTHSTDPGPPTSPTHSTTRPLHLFLHLSPVAFSSLLASLQRLPITMATAHQRKPMVKLGLAGDTMLGRCVAEIIFQARQPDALPDSEREALPYFHKAQQQQHRQQQAASGTTVLFEQSVLDVVHEADLMFLNLECCVSTSTQRWPNPHKPFFFRAPPVAVQDLKALGVDAVTLGAFCDRMME